MTSAPKLTLAEEFDLTGKAENFVYEYMVDNNATQAAIRAGYKPNSARQTASRMLSKANVQDAVAKLRADRAKRYEISADNVLAEYAKIGFSNMDDYVDTATHDLPVVDFRGLSRDQLAAVSEITVDTRYEYEGRGNDRECVGTIDRVKFKLYDKTKGLDAIARNLGLFEKDNAQTAPTIVINGRAADL